MSESDAARKLVIATDKLRQARARKEDTTKLEKEVVRATKAYKKARNA